MHALWYDIAEEFHFYPSGWRFSDLDIHEDNRASRRRHGFTWGLE